MTESPSTKKMKNLSKTTSTQDGGGCFSLIFFSPASVLIVAVVLVLIFGKTTIPGTMSSAGMDEAGSEYGKENDLGYSALTPLFTPEVMYWEKDILRWANQWKLDPNMVATVMQIESCGSPLVKSQAGAMGLFQVMPYHFNKTEYPYAPDTNAQRGLAYLRLALDRYNDPRLAFAGYNGGITNAGKTETEWPQETARYTYWGTQIYLDAAAGKGSSPTLESWLENGGARLCDQARQHLGLSQ